MIAHMTAHFRGGPWDDKSKYQCCEKPHDHEITVEDVLPVYSLCGHYELVDDPIAAECFDELLVDVVYQWVDWESPHG